MGFHIILVLSIAGILYFMVQKQFFKGEYYSKVKRIIWYLVLFAVLLAILSGLFPVKF